MRHQRACLGKTDNVVDDLDQVFASDRADVLGQVQAELLVELVAADPCQVVTAGVEEVGVHQAPRALLSRRVAGPDSVVDVDQGLVHIVGRVLFEGRVNVVVDDVDLQRRQLHLLDLLGRVVADLLAGLHENLSAVLDVADGPQSADAGGGRVGTALPWC